MVDPTEPGKNRVLGISGTKRSWKIYRKQPLWRNRKGWCQYWSSRELEGGFGWNRKQIVRKRHSQELPSCQFSEVNWSGFQKEKRKWVKEIWLHGRNVYYKRCAGTIIGTHVQSWRIYCPLLLHLRNPNGSVLYELKRQDGLVWGA